MGVKPVLSHSGKNRDRGLSTTGCCEQFVHHRILLERKNNEIRNRWGMQHACGVGDKQVQNYYREIRTDGARLRPRYEIVLQETVRKQDMIV
jgi:hypothetical protein